MAKQYLNIGGRDLHLMKAYLTPNYEQRTILTNSVFDFVELWLTSRKEKKQDALFYWRQAKNFYLATENLDIEAKPLTAYYCCLNATKALLDIHNIPLTNISHGVSSARGTTQGNISKDKVIYTGGGVLFELSRILGDPTAKTEYLLKDLFYNVPCIHRTFTVTFTDCAELFIPVLDIVYELMNDGSRKVYARFKVDDKYANGHVKRYVPSVFEETMKDENGLFYRLKRRFKWDIHQPFQERKKELIDYHIKIRKDFYYIAGNSMLWYIKKDLPGNRKIIKRSQPTLIYGIFHWLSELVRYNPTAFAKILSSRQNWLIREFVEIGLTQFIDEISCEITGCNIMPTGYKK